MEGAVERLKRLFESGQRCMWFLLCDREATTLVSHPVLGEVPACERCAARAA